MENTKEAEETEGAKGGNNDEDAKWASWQLLFIYLSVERSEESFRVVFCSSKLGLFEDGKWGDSEMRMLWEYM